MTDPGAVSRETAGADEHGARAALRERFPAAAPGLERYAELLADAGVERGLIGPRERPRLWTRHLANSVALEELVPRDVRVVDVGSGAGLPGLPLALARPDLTFVLLEPLLRRATFLQEAVEALALDGRVSVRRGRAEDESQPLGQVVTARAVAPLQRLAGWTLPLVPVGGTLLAVKGSRAVQEAADAAAVLQRLGAAPAQVCRCGVGLIDPPATVIRVVRARAVASGRGRR